MFDNNNISKRGASQAQKFVAKIAGKKTENITIIEQLQGVTGEYSEWAQRAARNIDGCATYVALDVQTDENIRVARANFCRERLCAVCAWRRQAKFVATTYPVLEMLAADYRYLFFTLTLRNCSGEELPGAVSQLLGGFSLLLKYKDMGAVEGYIKSLEVTYNAETKEYHPHIHCLACVRENYFSAENQHYISHAKLAELWQTACKLDYAPVVDIRALKKTAKREPYIETMKYALKPQKDLKPENVMDYMRALRGRRLITFGGVVARLRTLDLEDLTDPAIDRESGIGVQYCVILKFNVTGGVYEITEEHPENV